MIDLISKFDEIREYTRKSKLSFRDAILKYYKELGEKQGFTVVENSSVIKNVVNYGKVDLVWIEPNTVFCIEFGVLEDIYRHLFKVVQMNPNMAVFILSSNSKCSPEKVREILLKTDILEDIRSKSVILDITEGRKVYP